MNQNKNCYKDALKHLVWTILEWKIPFLFDTFLPLEIQLMNHWFIFVTNCIYWLIIGLLGISGGQLSVNNQSTLAVCSAVKWRTMLEYPGRPGGVWSWCWKYKMSGPADWCWQSYSAGGVLTIRDVQLLSPANVWWISLSEAPITHRHSGSPQHSGSGVSEIQMV